MNHFPLFAMLLRLKDPARLPGESWANIHLACLAYARLDSGGIYFTMEGMPPKLTVKVIRANPCSLLDE
jgi:hypothetical protein